LQWVLLFWEQVVVDPYIGKLFAKEAAIKESIPLAYLPGAVKLKVKLCGDFIS
jgi:hypothetical protein